MPRSAHLSLATPLAQLPGVGPAYVKRLERLGLETVDDLLHYFPRRYDDLRQVKSLDELQQFGSLVEGEPITVRATILQVNAQRTRRGKGLVKAEVGNDKGSIEAVWFNQPYLAKQLVPGDEYIFAGKLKTSYGRPSLQSPTYEPVKGEQTHTARLVPVYPETEGLSSKWLRAKLKPLLELADSVPETVPKAVLEQYHLLSIGDALPEIHFPTDPEKAERARYRFDFEQILLRQLVTLQARHDWRESRRAPHVSYDAGVTKAFVSRLPWSLTDDQRKAAHEILQDLESDRPMMRMLQGDVGSGKTAVAAIAANQVAAAGFQTAIMAPTEVLARQHHRTLSELLPKPPVLLLGSQGAKEKREAKEAIQAGASVVVGTHALIQEDVVMPKLALAVIDEQHRFGVEQRNALQAETMPHLLSMTATPIPRSLALVAFGDQDLSVIEQMPSGRKPVVTRLASAPERPAAFEAIRDELRAGRQAFVVYPVIEDSKSGLKDATSEYERLAKGEFADFRVGLMHGRLKADEKRSVMERFKAGELDVLVATSVIEVGVDVPNATVMVIEEAQQFGLAQLHQFRGRVGRGADQSYAYLFAGTITQEDNERLVAMTKSNSGFDLAEVDLRLRGPGDLLGTKQSGFDVSLAGLTNPKLLKEAREAAQAIIEADPDLRRYPELKQRVLDADVGT